MECWLNEPDRCDLSSSVLRIGSITLLLALEAFVSTLTEAFGEVAICKGRSSFTERDFAKI